MKILKSVCAAAIIALTINAQAYQGMAVPRLHVSGRFLQNTSNQNVLLHGYCMAADAWYNGQNALYTDPSDYTSSSQCAGMLKIYNGIADILTTTNALYGTTQGWYNGYVRLVGAGTASGFAPGWTTNGTLSSPAQFNGWISNVLVPWINHCKADGLYVIICGDPSETYPSGDTGKNMTQQYQQNLTTYWTTVANAAGVKSAVNVMFEICNEPINIETSFGANNWASSGSSYFSALKNFMQPIVNAIRNTGADNVILVPSLGYQGQCQGFASYPVSGANIAYSGHYYPGYNNVHDNTSAVQSYWNSNYKPCADSYPLVITEMFWDPNNGSGYQNLWNASTTGFGNTVKSCIDGEGNVSYLVGMASDLLANMSSGSLANTTLGSSQGAQAWFQWLATYAEQGGSGSSPVANGTYKIVNRNSGMGMDASGAGTANGTQIQQWGYYGGSNQKWTVTDTGGGQYNIIGVASGRAIDVNGGGTANGTKVQLYDYYGGSNQKFTITATSSGYYRITPTSSTGSCLEVSGSSTADGALVQQYNWSGGNNQQWIFQSP
jgi:hypothetical protein